MVLNRQNILKLLYFLGTTFIIVAPALYNRYPLVYFDSGAYMEMAVDLEPSFHRASGYPLLMRLTGWLVSNWPVVLLQGLLLSLLLFRLISLLYHKHRWLYHFYTVLILSFFSSMSWYAAQLMPDIFTLIMLLAMMCVIIEKQLGWLAITLYFLVLFFSLITHLSHIPLVCLILLGVGVVMRLYKQVFVSITKAKWVVLTAPVLVAFFAVCTHNAVHGFGFRMSLASNVFITANLGEMGILKLYLDENCQELQSGLCDIKDSLPLETGGYLWEKDSPVQKHPGGWAAANEEYAPVVKDFLTEPRYLKWLIIGAVKATFKQMFQVELGSGLQYKYAEGSPPYWPMKTHFKQELNEYITSVQNKGGELPIDFFRIVHYLSIFFSCGIIGWAVITQRLNPQLATILLLIVIAYVLNAAITGVLANVYERLQCKLIPLFQLTALLVLYSAWKDQGLFVKAKKEQPEG